MNHYLSFYKSTIRGEISTLNAEIDRLKLIVADAKDCNKPLLEEEARIQIQNCLCKIRVCNDNLDKLDK